TKSAPASLASTHARTFSSSVKSAVSIITLTMAQDSWAASTTDRISSSTDRSSRDLSAPILMTISISVAPSKIARRASYAFTSARVAPSGNPTTVQTFTGEPYRIEAHSFTQVGLTQTDAKLNVRAS